MKKTVRMITMTLCVLLMAAAFVSCAPKGTAQEQTTQTAQPAAEQTTQATPEQTEQPSAQPTPNPAMLVETDPALPEGEQAYIIAEYGSDSAQWQMMEEYTTKNNMVGKLVYVCEINAWNAEQSKWSAMNSGSFNFSIPFAYASDGAKVNVLQNNSMTGGTVLFPTNIIEVSGGRIQVNLQDAADSDNDFGFGLFGFFVQGE